MPYQRGSGFVGLQQYLNANQEAGQRMGDELASQVEQQGAAAQGAIDAQRALTEQQIAAGVPQFNPYGLEPDEIVAAQANAAKGYAGPQDMGNVDAIATQAQEAQQAAKLAGTEAGRSVLMQRAGNAAPTVGGRSLDAALASRGAGNRLAAASSRFGDLQKYLTTAQAGVAESVKGAQEQTKKVQGQYAALPTPQYAPPAAPTAPRVDPRVSGNQQVTEDNKRLIRMRGGRG